MFDFVFGRLLPLFRRAGKFNGRCVNCLIAELVSASKMKRGDAIL